MRQERLRSLDGIRFFAILSVILYHYIPYVIPGGFLGVDIFLVLSGFLLGASFANESERSFSYFSYLKKRFIRLSVPLVAMLIFSIAFFTIVEPKFLFNVKTTIWSSLLYINNYVQIWSGASYFENFINPSPFVHFWYLGVQMQLYILTPFIFFLGRRFLGDDRKVGFIFIALAILSALAMGIIYTPGTDPSRVYFGTDTRGFSFLIGLGLSLIFSDGFQFNRRYKRRRNIYSSRRRDFSFVKTICFFLVLALIILMIFTMKDGGSFTYRGGIFIFDILVATLLILLKDISIGEAILGFPLLAKLGIVSFSVYLWYYPVFSYFTFGKLATTFFGGMWYLQLVLLFVLGIIFYLVFEEDFTKRIMSLRGISHNRGNKHNKSKKNLIKNVVVFGVLCVSLFGVVTAKSGRNETVTQLEARLAEEQRKIAEKKEKERLKAGKDIEDIEGLDRSVMLFSREQKITFFGDSILLSGSSAINNVFPESYIDGNVGRQLYNSISQIEALGKEGKLSDHVVVIIGTNGSFTEKQLDDFVKAIGKNKKIVFLTTFVPRSWQDSVNETLAAYAKKKKNVYLFDWYKEVSNNPQWLEVDKVHLNQEGGKALANFIAKNYYETFDKDHKILKKVKENSKK